MSELSGAEAQSHEHYPYVTRSLLRLYGEGVLTNVTELAVEPEYGYASRIGYSDGSYRVTYGSDLGINAGASGDLAKDKGYSKFMLRNIGVNCPTGAEFVLPWWAEAISPKQNNRGNYDIKTSDQAGDYVDSVLGGYPVYVKPVKGSQGHDIYRVHEPVELTGILDMYNEKKIKVAVVEEAVTMPDYRVVVLDGELISAYQRIPLQVTGDGKSTIQQLIIDLQEKYAGEGRDTLLRPDDPRIIHHLSRSSLSVEDTPAENEVLALASISNLSAGGTSEDVTDKIDSRWVDLSAYVARNFNLRLCGVDLACADISASEADYSVLEVNASPGLDHYAASGYAQKATVDRLYAKVFNAMAS